MVFPVVVYRCENWIIKRLSAKEILLSNCGAGEDSQESLGQQGNQPLIFIRRADDETEAAIL